MVTTVCQLSCLTGYLTEFLLSGNISKVKAAIEYVAFLLLPQQMAQQMAQRVLHYSRP